MDDDGELNFLVDNSGAFLAICMKCKRTWQGSMNEVSTEGGFQSELTSSNPVQIQPRGDAVSDGGEFFVDGITDPGGAPASIIDIDQGFRITGRVTLPNWLSGKGQVCVYADEPGAPIDGRLSPCAEIVVTGKTGEPGSTTYPWSITFPGNPPVLPDPSPGAQLYRLAAIFRFGDQLTDIMSPVELGTYLIT